MDDDASISYSVVGNGMPCEEQVINYQEDDMNEEEINFS